MRKNRLAFKLLFLLIGFLLHVNLSAQFTDTITNVYQDKELAIWAENYIVKTGFINKTIKGYQYPLSNHIYQNLDGKYALRIIERQDYDTLSVTLYWLRCGSDNERPVIVERITKKDQKSTFQAIGRKKDLLSLSKLHLIFEKYNKFSQGTQLFCYEMLLQNYEWRMQGYEE